MGKKYKFSKITKITSNVLNPMQSSILLHFNYLFKSLPWLVWLSGLSVSLRTKGSLVRFQVRLQARSPVGGS